ncbi:hypothetical protein BZG36_01546 [Bifiguratus adelaidae]|uniref:sterol 22-desaturase n=1 Tax=Bifiguratus adelaidae TaxID=1938954 RepID=A0A261Y417_9FUNG|nr:hypothetical protein BZG36_01546 [Bifiguratus adelaidae]
MAALASQLTAYLSSGERVVSFFKGSLVPKQTISAGAAVCISAALFLAYEQYWYTSKKQHLPGPRWKVPVIGTFLESLNPTFEGYLSKWNSGALSCVSVFHRFIVIASTCELSRKILLNAPQNTEPSVVDSMRKILTPENWIFLHGKAHQDYRRGLNVLFTRRALGIYAPVGGDVYSRHFQEWLALDGKAEPYQLRFRELNMEASLRVFLGYYIPKETAQKISTAYLRVTAALELVNFPIALPFTKVWYAMRAREFIVNCFIDAVKQSRVRMAEGGTPNCMLDAWIESMIEERASGKKIREFADKEIALVILTFLFASQDATTSAVTWAFQLLADHPQVLERIRKEQEEIRGDNLTCNLSYELIEKMQYTRQVVMEVLRLRPPVLMIPYQTTRNWAINDDYVVPKGAMVIPTFYPALHDPEVYLNPDSFDPDRWGPEGDAHNHPKNFLVFGVGPHYCLGKEYAIMHIMGIIAQASVMMDWEHIRTPKSDKITIFATIYPQDGAIMKFRPRGSIQAST